jgi:hypothetical protein
VRERRTDGEGMLFACWDEMRIYEEDRKQAWGQGGREGWHIEGCEHRKKMPAMHMRGMQWRKCRRA